MSTMNLTPTLAAAGAGDASPEVIQGWTIATHTSAVPGPRVEATHPAGGVLGVDGLRQLRQLELDGVMPRAVGDAVFDRLLRLLP